MCWDAILKMLAILKIDKGLYLCFALVDKISEGGFDWVENVLCSTQMLSNICREGETALNILLLVQKIWLECRCDDDS